MTGDEIFGFSVFPIYYGNLLVGKLRLKFRIVPREGEFEANVNGQKVRVSYAEFVRKFFNSENGITKNLIKKNIDDLLSGVIKEVFRRYTEELATKRRFSRSMDWELYLKSLSEIYKGERTQDVILLLREDSVSKEIVKKTLEILEGNEKLKKVIEGYKEIYNVITKLGKNYSENKSLLESIKKLLENSFLKALYNYDYHKVRFLYRLLEDKLMFSILKYMTDGNWFSIRDILNNLGYTGEERKRAYRRIYYYLRKLENLGILKTKKEKMEIEVSYERNGKTISYKVEREVKLYSLSSEWKEGVRFELSDLWDLYHLIAGLRSLEDSKLDVVFRKEQGNVIFDYMDTRDKYRSSVLGNLSMLMDLALDHSKINADPTKITSMIENTLKMVLRSIHRTIPVKAEVYVRGNPSWVKVGEFKIEWKEEE